MLYRGHAREAVATMFENPQSIPPHLVEAALLAPPPDTAPAMFRGWITNRSLLAAMTTLPWFLAQGDTAAIRQIERRSDSTLRAGTGGSDGGVASYGTTMTRACLALLRHDTVTAIARLESLPDSLCPACYFHRLMLARLLSARHENRKAAKLLDRWLTELQVPSEVFWTLERARVAERLGDREKAARDYQYVVAVWRHADSELQPYVTEAREGLSRLAAEPRQ
jgi:hypothetical protein